MTMRELVEQTSDPLLLQSLRAYGAWLELDPSVFWIPLDPSDLYIWLKPKDAKPIMTKYPGLVAKHIEKIRRTKERV